MKTCSRCGETKPRSEFNRGKSPDGLRPYCKVCHRAYARRWRQNNPDRARASGRRWAKANPEAARTHRRRWNAKNRERQRDAVRAWYLENKSRRREVVLEWRRQNREAMNATARRWRKANSAKVREYQHRRRAAIQNSAPLLDGLIADLLTQPCAYCGSTENTSIDHIVPLSRGGKHEANNLAPACRPCNSSKGKMLLSEWGGPPDELAA